MCFSTILSRVLDKYFVYMPPTPLSNGPSVNKVLSCHQLVLYDWCNKGCGMCYHVCGVMYVTDPLLLIGPAPMAQWLCHRLTGW